MRFLTRSSAEAPLLRIWRAVAVSKGPLMSLNRYPPDRRDGFKHRLRNLHTRLQPPHNIPRHLIPIRLIQDFMPRRRVQLDRDIGHSGIPIPLPQLLQQDPACCQRVCVAGCDEDGQVAADARELRGIGQPGGWGEE